LLPKDHFASVNAGSPPGTAAKLLTSLLIEQKRAWPQLAEGYRALSSIEVREINCNGFSVTLQWNPRRIVSTDAKVDDKTVRERKCFLCPENLPESQKAISFDGDFLILCNPNPIFERHFTVSSVKHVPQLLGAHIETLLSLTEAVSGEFSVFYNGPECGASAPDHLHFQLSPAGGIPVESDAKVQTRLVRKKMFNAVNYSSLADYGRRVIVMDSQKKEKMAAALAKLLIVMEKSDATSPEPKMNLLSTFQDGVWRSIVFPRRKHRPDVFYREGNERVLVSPALVDMGGLIITPRRMDFDRIDAKMLESILDEVSVSDRELERIFDAM